MTLETESKFYCPSVPSFIDQSARNKAQPFCQHLHTKDSSTIPWFWLGHFFGLALWSTPASTAAAAPASPATSAATSAFLWHAQYIQLLSCQHICLLTEHIFLPSCCVKPIITLSMVPMCEPKDLWTSYSFPLTEFFAVWMWTKVGD